MPTTDAPTPKWWASEGQKMQCVYCLRTDFWRSDRFPHSLYARCVECR